MCSAAAHASCCERANVNETKTQEADGEEKTQEWWCPQCTNEIQNAETGEASKLGLEIKKRSHFFSALTIQSNFMMYCEMKRYKRFLEGLIFLQAVMRKQRQRRLFMDELSKSYRPIRVKAIDFKGLQHTASDHKTGSICCIMSIYNNIKSSDIEEGERHLFRFDTVSMQHGSSGKWNESFLIYSIDCRWDIITTVVNKDEAGRYEFLGQSITNAGTLLKRSIITGRKQRLKVYMGGLEIEPRETSNKQVTRLDTISGRDKNWTGRVNLEISTFSNVVNKCGVIEEMLSALIRGAKKRWWALLFERTLYLFSHKGDSRYKSKIEIRNGTQLELKNGVIKIGCIDQTYMFTHNSAVERNDWYMKLSGKYYDVLEKGANKYKSLQKRKDSVKEEEESKGEDAGEGVEPAEDSKE